MACDAVLMTILTVARLLTVTYDPTGTLDLVVYFPNDIDTPLLIELNLPDSQQGPDVPGIPFGGHTGGWSSSQGEGHLLSFDGLDSHATPNGAGIDPRQPIVEFDGDRVLITQLDNLFGDTVQKGDFFKASISSQHIFVNPGLVEVNVGSDRAWVNLEDPSLSQIPVAGIGTAGPFTMDTLIEVINPACEERPAVVDFFDPMGNPAARFETVVPASGTVTIPGEDLFPPGPLVTGSMRVTCEGCGVSSVWNVNETIPCDAPSELDAAPAWDMPCGEPFTVGTAGVSAPKPGNILVFPQFADGSGLPVNLPYKPAVAAQNGFDQSATVTFVACDEDGVEIGRFERTFNPKAHISQFVDQLFPDLKDMKFTGYLSSDVPVSGTNLKTNERGLPAASVDPIRINGEYFLPDGPFWHK